MKIKNFFSETATSIVFILVFAICASQANAELKINSVYPTLGIKGQDLPVTISGSGFDQNTTRVSMSLDVGHKKSIINSLELSGSTQRIVISDRRAYIASSGGGFYVMDITNLEYPKILGSIKTLFVRDVAIGNSYAYLACGDYFEGSLTIVDIRDPSNLQIVGTLKTEWCVRKISIADNKAYLALHKGGFNVIDISIPENPKIIGSMDKGYVYRSVRLLGDKAYTLAEYWDGNGWGGDLQIINISNPKNMTIIGSIKVPGGSRGDLVVSDDRAYVADGCGGGLHIIDISTPSKPEFISSVKTSGEAMGVTISDGKAFLADGSKHLQVIDIKNPQQPQIIGSISTEGDATHVAVIGNKAFVTCGEHISDYMLCGGYGNWSGLQVIDTDTLAMPQVIGHVKTINEAWGVSIVNNTAYVTCGGYGQDGDLQIIDVSTPLNPHILGTVSVNPGGEAGGVDVVDGIAYGTWSDGGLYLIDVSNPSIPKIIGSLNTGSANDVKVFDGNAYVADSYKGLMIIDVRNPSQLKLIGSVKTTGYGGKLTVSGNTVFITCRGYNTWTGLQVIDISDLSNPQIIGSIRTQGKAWDIALLNDKIFIADDGYGIQVIDVSIPSNPKIIGSAETSGLARSIAISNGRLHVACGGYLPWNGIQVFDITNIQKPVMIGSVKTLNFGWDIQVVDSKAYVADYEEGFVIVPIPSEINSVIPKSDKSISVTLPSPQIPGNYTIRAFTNTGEASELPGAVTFVPPEDSYLLDTKAIIIAGDKSGNNIRTETHISADFAYQTLLFQGYTAESVNYLSFDTFQAGVDTKASLAAVSDAVNNWSIKDPKATELLIYLVGHGENGYFVINDNEHLTVEQLDQWLDNLQNAYDIPVTVIYDACYSGSFLPKLTPPVGKKRVVISSASAAEKAYFPVSAVSFSYQFWNAVYQGNEIGKAFRAAANQMKTYQTAMMDADGDGIGTEAEIALAENMKIRRNYKPLTDVPYIYRVSDPQVLHDQTSAKITAGVSYIQDGTKVQRVWATVVPPDFRPDGPVTNLPEIEMTDPDGDGIYENTYTQFIQNGTYKINVCAMNQKGMFALFRDTTVVRETGYIAKVSPAQEVSQTRAKIWAALKPNIPVSRVWAKVQPPVSGVPPIELELSDPEHDGIYEAVFSGFTAKGTYTAELYAADTQGYTSPAVLTQISYDSEGDEYETDNSPDNIENKLDFDKIQHHTFHAQGDTDWMKMLLNKNIPYSVRISNRNLCETVIDLIKQVIPGDMNSDKKVDLKDVIAVLRIVSGSGYSASVFSDVNGDKKIGLEEAVYGLQVVSGLTAGSGSRLITVKNSDASFDWTPPESGIYYLRVGNITPDSFGQNVGYDIGLYKPFAGSTGIIRGTVKSSSGEPISEAMIFTDDGGTDLSRDNGAFSITDAVGKRIITVQADGYEEYRTAVTVAETAEQVLNIILVPIN